MSVIRINFHWSIESLSRTHNIELRRENFSIDRKDVMQKYKKLFSFLLCRDVSVQWRWWQQAMERRVTRAMKEKLEVELGMSDCMKKNLLRNFFKRLLTQCWRNVQKYWYKGWKIEILFENYQFFSKLISKNFANFFETLIKRV